MRQTGTKTDPRVVRSKADMRKALLQLMAQKPFAAVSITDIVKQAKYNRGTFYANYANKEDLLDDMISETIKDLLRSFRAPYEKVNVFYPHELHANSIMIFDHIAQHADFYAIVTRSDALPVLKEKMFVSLKRIIMEELVHDDSDVDPELLVVYSLHALLGLIFHWIESGFAHPPSYMQEQLVKILNHQPANAKKGIKTRHSDQ
ncbi:TetR family transcriptional regulator [Paenibacillus sp. 32O-W]|jgi:AcrR family transcriptional regulator|uniref:TetR family transcriptional regulator n=1 Tax=Paenibacillus cisolokensis TaxID=1658519 RepID=A0ABQ4N5F3_9BACL|nr:MULTISPECIES: TetR/AcrR family transcriptional regulator [Paenibacillus]ALS29732.1 TetR family transcriptional regulator [Paenibacillus sp. 32O-W]GIQ63364.1 TetR family transcriptional regulator [Paenibacillus cisolokensis]